MKKTATKLVKSRKRVLVALSGGIDSAVSAWKLLQDGYEVEAAFMKNWSSTTGLKYDECPWLTDRQDALRVAAFLGIPMHTLNFEKEYEQNVLNYFFAEYSAGRTPNPDVMCNKEIKFKLLYDWAMHHGFDYIATGHYANIVPVQSKTLQHDSQAKAVPGKRKTVLNNDSFQLTRSADEFKDQTYFIYNIRREQLPHILFPIGGMNKAAVRKLAQKIGLPNADKKESMGLCFVGKIRLKEFLQQKLKNKTGRIVDMSGVVIGKHEGLAYYTIGQRQGVKVGKGGPWYVVRKDLHTNTLVVTNDPNDAALAVKQIEIHSLNWLGGQMQFPLAAHARFRHQGELVKVTITPAAAGQYNVAFQKPQKAIASGQSLVIYQGAVCLGGGVIM